MLTRTKLATWFSSKVAGAPVYALNFLSGLLDPSLTFTRASTAWYYNSSGILTQATTNAPRFDYNPTTLQLNGLLIEQQSQNLLLYSSATNNAAWASGVGSPTLTVNSAGAPDGTATFNHFVRTSTAAQYVGIAPGKAAVNQPYTFSGFVKAGAVGNYLNIRVQGSYPNRMDFQFNLSNGTVALAQASGTGFTGAASIKYIGGGIYYFVGTALTTDATAELYVHYSFNSNYQSFIDGNDSLSNTDGYIWGLQLEQLPFATSYIPTTSSTVTRAADSLVNTSIGGWFNPTQGAFFAEYYIPYSPTKNRVVEFNDGTYNNRMFFNASSIDLQELILATNATQYLNNDVSASGIVKAGISYGGTAQSGAHNGVSDGQYVAGVTPTGITTLNLGGGGVPSGSFMNGWLRSFRYYNTALTAAQLQQVTT